MNNIQKVIKDSLKGFDEKFGNLIAFSGNHPVSKELKSHLLTTISNLLSAIEAEVKEKENPIIKATHPEAPLNEQLDNFEKQCRSLGYDQALSDIQELLKSAKEQIK